MSWSVSQRWLERRQHHKTRCRIEKVCWVVEYMTQSGDNPVDEANKTKEEEREEVSDVGLTTPALAAVGTRPDGRAPGSAASAS
jgi:hypothetical protein